MIPKLPPKPLPWGRDFFAPDNEKEAARIRQLDIHGRFIKTTGENMIPELPGPVNLINASIDFAHEAFQQGKQNEFNRWYTDLMAWHRKVFAGAVRLDEVRIGGDGFESTKRHIIETALKTYEKFKKESK